MKIQTQAFRKIESADAGEICSRVELSAEALRFLVPGLTPQGFLAGLTQGGLPADAVRFLAFAVPAREGVWWACMTAQALGGPTATPAQVLCLDKAAAWVHEPNEEARRACFAAAEAIGLKGAAAFAALAAFWSGGSMAPPDMPEAPPDPRLAPIAVGASVLLSVTAAEPQRMDARFEEALRRGLDIADGGNGRI